MKLTKFCKMYIFVNQCVDYLCLGSQPLDSDSCKYGSDVNNVPRNTM